MTSVTDGRVGPVTIVDPSDIELVEALHSLRRSALDLEEACRSRLDAIPVRDRPSGRNLVHYLALRQHDLRHLQGELAARGLSSLGHAEAHLPATIDAVLRHLGSGPGIGASEAPTRRSSRELMHRHTRARTGRTTGCGGVVHPPRPW